MKKSRQLLAVFSGSLRPLQNIYSLMKNVQIRHSGVGRNPLNPDKLI